MQGLTEKELHRQLRRDFPEAPEEDLTAAIARCGGFLGQAREILEEGSAVSPQTEGFVDSLARRDWLGLTRTLVGMERWKRDQLLETLGQWLELTENALASRLSGAPASALAARLAAQRTGGELYQGVRCLKKAMEYTRGNVSPGAVCGWLAWSLR